MAWSDRLIICPVGTGQRKLLWSGYPTYKHRGGNAKAREVTHHLWAGLWNGEMQGFSSLPQLVQCAGYVAVWQSAGCLHLPIWEFLCSSRTKANTNH